MLGFAARDMNPLGYPLKKDSVYLTKKLRAKEMHQKAEDLLSGRRVEEIKNENLDIFNKYQK